MEKGVKNARKLRAALIAGGLAAAIALTGTLAWRNMTQRTLNEALLDKNPGGRIHDDFDGVNKDIYAENFTDVEKGAAVFARIRLREYMEVGEDAGSGRTVTTGGTEGGGGTGGEGTGTDGEGTGTDEGTEPDPGVDPGSGGGTDTGEDEGPAVDPGSDPGTTGRKVKVTTYINAAGEEVEPDITDPTTWYIHKPETTTEKDPFHEFWRWEMGGEKIYMPTFNKNKDSISPDVNGTYLGPDGIFNTDDAYDDYVAYTAGKKVTADAYYDADGDNDADENFDASGNWIGGDNAPGGGGTEKTEENPDGNYTKVSEEHTAQSTLNGLGFITMADWKEAGMPVCNKWVWDEDGWFYWPEPIQPQTATGLLLDRLVTAGGTNEKCYYAIEVEGQFISTDLDWGTPEVKDGDTVTQEATGFYIDGFTDDAKALIEQAMKVKINGENWYFPLGNDLFKQIEDDDGELGEPFWAGEDHDPGTADDRAVLYIKDGVSVGDPARDYGQWFLPPRTDPYEPYYTAAGDDGVLGTGDDERLWVQDGFTFPNGVVDEIIDTVTVTPPGDMDVLEGGMVEMEVGKTLAAPFNAALSLKGTSVIGDWAAVTWSVAALDGTPLKSGTRIDPDTGILTVDENETPRELVVTATSKLDDRQKGSYHVKVYGKLNVRLTLADSNVGVTSIQAGKTIQVKAWLYRGEELADLQPDAFTWSDAALKAKFLATDAHILTVDPTDSKFATLTAGRGTSGQNMTFSIGCAGVDPATDLSISITAPEPVNVTVEPLGETVAEAGQTLSFRATLDHTDELSDTTVTWKLYDTDGKAITSGFNVTPNDADNTVAVKIQGGGYTYNGKNGTITIKADADDPTAGTGGVGSAKFTVALPKSIELTAAAESMKLGGSIKMSAILKDAAGEDYASQFVTWTVTKPSGQAINGVTISASGSGVQPSALLESTRIIANGTKVKVTATSTAAPSVSQSVEVTVINDNTVTIDGENFLILKYYPAQNKALILTKNCIQLGKFALGGASGREYWVEGRTHIHNAIMDPWLARHSILNDAAIEVTNYTRKYEDGSFASNKEKIFVLSEADIYGTYNNGQTSGLRIDDYTDAGTGKLTDPSGKNWVATYNGTAVDWWLRSPCNENSSMVVFADGTRGHRYWAIEDTVGIRPALWVDTTKAALR